MKGEKVKKQKLRPGRKNKGPVSERLQPRASGGGVAQGEGLPREGERRNRGQYHEISRGDFELFGGPGVTNRRQLERIGRKKKRGPERKESPGGRHSRKKRWGSGKENSCVRKKRAGEPPTVGGKTREKQRETTTTHRSSRRSLRGSQKKLVGQRDRWGRLVRKRTTVIRWMGEFRPKTATLRHNPRGRAKVDSRKKTLFYSGKQGLE